MSEASVFRFRLYAEEAIRGSSRTTNVAEKRALEELALHLGASCAVE
jgi:hypothetical protein